MMCIHGRADSALCPHCLGINAGVSRQADEGKVKRVGNQGRSTTGEAIVPYYRQSDRVEAAKYLRLTVTRYLTDRATMKDIREAMQLLEAAVKKDA